MKLNLRTLNWTGAVVAGIELGSLPLVLFLIGYLTIRYVGSEALYNLTTVCSLLFLIPVGISVTKELFRKYRYPKYCKYCGGKI
jgi:hypothetical protein